MRISKSQYSTFLDNQLGCNTILIHGNNSDRIRSYTEHLIKILQSRGFVLSELDFQSIITSEQDFENELISHSLFGNKKVLFIRNAQNEIPKKIRDIIDKNIDSTIIFTAEKINATMKAYFEKNDKKAILSFYKDDLYDLRSQIENILLSHETSYTREVIDKLYEIFKDNSLFLRSELEKLIIYTLKNISIESIRECLELGKQSSLTDLANFIANKDFTSAIDCINELMLDGFSPITIIRATINYFENMVKAKCMLISGKPIQEIEKEMSTFIFFKEMKPFLAHLQKTSLSNLVYFIQTLLRTEFLYKKSTLSDGIYLKSAVKNIIQQPKIQI